MFYEIQVATHVSFNWKNEEDLSGCSLVVGGLRWAVDPEILGSIPTRSSSGLLDTRFWQLGSCICGLLATGGSKGPDLVRFHIIKEKKKKKKKERMRTTLTALVRLHKVLRLHCKRYRSFSLLLIFLCDSRSSNTNYWDSRGSYKSSS